MTADAADTALRAPRLTVLRAGRPGDRALRLGALLVLATRSEADAAQRGGATLEVMDGTARRRLWSGRSGAPADLVATGPARALALFPGRALVSVERTGDGARGRVVVQGNGLPDRLFPGSGGGALALHAGPAPRMDYLTAGGTPVAGAARPLPEMTGQQTPSRLAIGADGVLYLAADDPRAGFALWRAVPHATDSWTRVTDNGAGRFACNAAVFDAVAWQGGLALAAGPAPGAEVLTFGLRMAGEVLHVRGDEIGLIFGETRSTPAGLLRPLAGVHNRAAWELDRFTRLAAVPGGQLVAATERTDGGGALYAVDREGRVTDMVELTTRLAGLGGVPDPHAIVAQGPGSDPASGPAR